MKNRVSNRCLSTMHSGTHWHCTQASNFTAPHVVQGHGFGVRISEEVISYQQLLSTSFLLHGIKIEKSHV